MTVLRLFPPSTCKLPLVGLYLGLRLHRRAAPGGITIYGNYIVSLDGRISMASVDGEQVVPGSLANKRDWRLYQELAAQSDIMLTSARYFRQLEKGNAQDLLPVGKEPEYADLTDWRAQEGMKPQPDVAILSLSLDIPDRALDAVSERRVLVLTGPSPEASRVAALEQRGVSVLCCPTGQPEGVWIRQALIDAGYRAAYMIAGPEVHRSLLSGGLDLLFLTQRHRLLGGADTRGILEGDLDAPVDMELASLYLDEATCLHERGSQSFACFKVLPPA